MFTMVTESSRRVVSAMAAVAVVAFAGLALDQGHRGAVPEGAVTVGQLTPVNVMQMANLTLPEITVTASREAPEQFAASVPVLPEVVVTASRGARLAVVAAELPTQG